MTHDAYHHADGTVCIWLDGLNVWFVPLDVGGEGYDCRKTHGGLAAETWAEMRHNLPKEPAMSDNLSNSVILPREDFLELQAAAYNPNDTTLATRVASTTQTTIVFAVLAGAVTAGSFGVAKAMDWYEERSLKRWMRKRETPHTISTVK